MPSKSMKTITSELVEAEKALAALHEERAVVCNAVRYRDLTMPGGLIFQAEKVVEEARKRFQDKLVRLTGIPASALRGPSVKDLIR